MEALAVSTLGSLVFPIGRNKELLYWAIDWSDTRSNGYQPQKDFLKERIGTRRLFQITGYFEGSTLPQVLKILWFRENMPQVYEKTWKFLFPEDYLIWRLTGETATDYSMACESLMLDLKEKKWSSEIFEAIEVDKDLCLTFIHQEQ